MLRFDVPADPTGFLESARIRLENGLGGDIDDALRARLMLAIHEILANLVRHSDPRPSWIEIDFMAPGNGRNDHSYCVIRDNGGPFQKFSEIWNHIAEQNGMMFATPNLGLTMVRHLWPGAFYVMQKHRNLFVLPLTAEVYPGMPDFFRPDPLQFVQNVRQLVAEAA